MASAGDAPSELERQLIMFSLHGEHYGLPIASVQEIIRYTPPRVTAAARGLVQGLINLRGRVVPVLDLSDRLDQVLEVTERTRILIVEASAGALGLIVDAVDGVVDVPADRIEPIPGAGADDALGDEIVTIGDQLVMLLDADRALGRALPQDPRPSGSASAPSSSGSASAPSSSGSASAPSSSGPESAPRPSGPARAPRPAGPPPARRRSAATPQVPRSRRRPGDTRDTSE